eukprot:UN12370
MKPKYLMIMCVHAHVRFKGQTGIESLRKIFGHPTTCFLSIPCCSKFRHTNDLGKQPDIEFIDPCYFSAHKQIRIWKWKSEDFPIVDYDKFQIIKVVYPIKVYISTNKIFDDTQNYLIHQP